MTPWGIALDFVLNYEGGWCNNPGDRGGETFRGISRVFWPAWEGWSLVDTIKTERPDDFAAVLFQDFDLKEMVSKFYRVNFWEPCGCDMLPGKVAAAVFDFAVNSGDKVAVKQLQATLGAEVDGVVGPQTVKAAFDAGEEGVIKYLAARAKFLHAVMDNNPSQQVWAINWFRRLFYLANVVLEGQGVNF